MKYGRFSIFGICLFSVVCFLFVCVCVELLLISNRQFLYVPIQVYNLLIYISVNYQQLNNIIHFFLVTGIEIEFFFLKTKTK